MFHVIFVIIIIICSSSSSSSKSGSGGLLTAVIKNVFLRLWDEQKDFPFPVFEKLFCYSSYYNNITANRGWMDNNPAINIVIIIIK